MREARANFTVYLDTAFSSAQSCLTFCDPIDCSTPDFPGGSDGKESACNTGDLGSNSGLGRSPKGGHGNPLQDSCLENPHGQRSLAGCSPWRCKESDTTERLSSSSHAMLDASVFF